MDLSELRNVWREAGPEPVISIRHKEDVTMLLKGRSAEVKKEILKRLTTEIKTYSLIGLFVLCILFTGEFTVRRVLLTVGGALLVVGPVLAALAHQEYRLRTLPMSGSLGESIAMLIRAIDSTARLYLFAYVVTIGLSLGLLETLLVWGNGWNVWTILFVPIGLASMVWSYFSGRGYAERMFRAYRSNLVTVRSELESV